MFLGGWLARTCDPTTDVDSLFAQSWCSQTPHQILSLDMAHCAGCYIAAAGFVMLAVEGAMICLKSRSGARASGAATGAPVPS